MTAVSLADFRPRTTFPSPLPTRIQYACGLNVFPGWLNVDGFDGALMWHFSQGGVPRNIADNVVKIDLLALHPFPDNHFDFAFAEDFIEHLTQADAILFLVEALRTLKPGGVLRLSAPCLEGVMAAHFRNADRTQALRETEAAYTRWGHLHFFSYDSLRTMALALGFSKFEKAAFRESEHAELRGLETRAEQADYQINLYADLTK